MQPYRSINDVLERHARLALDTMILIYLFEGTDRRAETSARLIDAIAEGRTGAVASAAVLAEITVRPAALGQMALVEQYADYLLSLENLEIVPLTPDLAVDAGLIRGITGAPLADSIHLATARGAGATGFITNDRRLPAVARVETIVLDHIVLD